MKSWHQTCRLGNLRSCGQIPNSLTGGLRLLFGRILCTLRTMGLPLSEKIAACYTKHQQPSCFCLIFSTQFYPLFPFSLEQSDPNLCVSASRTTSLDGLSCHESEVAQAAQTIRPEGRLLFHDLELSDLRMRALPYVLKG